MFEKRTRSDRKYRPVRREVSRYGVLENRLRLLRENQSRFNVSDVSVKTRNLTTSTIHHLLRFTSGVRRVGDNLYEFTDDDIKVMNE